MTKIRPFLKWAGNKYRCLHHILESLPTAHRLIEPFTGSGAVFMNTDYPLYLLGEDNQDLINLFYYLKKEGRFFIDYCETLFCEANNAVINYYNFRDQFNTTPDPRAKAALFLYLNRHGYNGLCRYSQKGNYNVPFGRYKKPYFPRKEMNYFHEKSQKAQLIHGDFRNTFRAAKTGDLIYCDPPYAPIIQTSNFSSYTSKKFGKEEQIILATLAMESAERGITVIISNHDTDFTRHLYRHGEIRSFPVKRWISRYPQNRLPVQELLAVFR